MTCGTCATGLHPLLAAGPPPPTQWHLQVSFLLPHFADMFMPRLPGVRAAHATALFCFLMMGTMLSRVIRDSSWSRCHGQQWVVMEQRDSHTDMSTDPWADLVTRNNSAGVFQGGRKPGGQCRHQSGALLATWSRLLLPPIPPTQSSSTLTTSPPQLSHNGLLTRTAQASTTSPDLS